jgi:hypothetical protein
MKWLGVTLAPFRCRRRGEPTGSDRHGTLYWLVDNAVWASNDHWRDAPESGAAVAASEGVQGDGGGRGEGRTGRGEEERWHQGCAVGGAWRCYMPGASRQRLIEFLNPAGPRERLLLRALQSANAPSAVVLPGAEE